MASVTSLNDWLESAAVDNAPIVPFVQKEPLRTMGFAPPPGQWSGRISGLMRWEQTQVPKAESLYRVQASPPISKPAELPCSSPRYQVARDPKKPYPLRSQLSQLGSSCWLTIENSPERKSCYFEKVPMSVTWSLHFPKFVRTEEFVFCVYWYSKSRILADRESLPFR